MLCASRWCREHHLYAAPCRRRQNQRQQQNRAGQSRRQQAKHYLAPLFICKCPCLGLAFIYFLLLAFFFVSQRAEGRAGAATAACSLQPDCNPLLHLAGITLGFLSKDKPETTAWEGRAFGAMVRWQPQVVASVRPTCHVQPFYGHVKLAICPTGHCLENNVARQEAASMWQ